jgi:hypothetical protein
VGHLGWIVDLFRDVDDIRAAGQTIVYCLNQKVGYLAIFVCSKVGVKEDEEFVRLMDVIDCLPPGLDELVISERPADVPVGSFDTGNWIARFEGRSLDDIRALGRNSPDDDRTFAAAARLSELNLATYRTMMRPWVRALANQPAADLAQALHPLRLGFRRRQSLVAMGAEAGGGRQPVPRAADAGLGPDHRHPGNVWQGAGRTREAVLRRLLWLASRAGVRRTRRPQRGTAVAREAGGTGDPDADARCEVAHSRPTPRSSSSRICRSPRSSCWYETSSSCCNASVSVRWRHSPPWCRRRMRGCCC